MPRAFIEIAVCKADRIIRQPEFNSGATSSLYDYDGIACLVA